MLARAQLDNVVNYDFPAKPKLFVHRAGRAARAGRAGRAISLVEPEELPYLVDLNLYLGRTLRPVPISEGADRGAGDATDFSADESGASGLGQVVALAVLPPNVLELEVEYVERQMRETVEVADLHRVAMRALGMVKKTRSAASKASVARARELPKALGIHPLCLDRVDVGAEARRTDMLTNLKMFKPNAATATVKVSSSGGGLFETKVSGATKRRGSGVEDATDTAAAARAERAAREAVEAQAAAGSRQLPEIEL